MRVARRSIVITAAALGLVGALSIGPGAIAQEAAPVQVGVPEGAAPTSNATVVVHVVRNGRPAAGRVTIRDEEGHEASCEANESGECELAGVGGGRHVVQATSADGIEGRARAVMIPDDGKVSLIVQLPAN